MYVLERARRRYRAGKGRYRGSSDPPRISLSPSPSSGIPHSQFAPYPLSVIPSPRPSGLVPPKANTNVRQWQGSRYSNRGSPSLYSCHPSPFGYLSGFLYHSRFSFDLHLLSVLIYLTFPSLFFRSVTFLPAD
ncbi:hypothetical protein FA13DRAFT_1524551 [Coprinellus micaceus]|uniref:Uncharacterized protein n=1 Tax=Coprinellus micaceus TaxID=71717 RepID=A0A4Y7SJL8_COPMI|nr:hypothetical protein FA13DRAFT_1524551 [Coprinellus micaceus]